MQYKASVIKRVGNWYKNRQISGMEYRRKKQFPLKGELNTGYNKDGVSIQ